MKQLIKDFLEYRQSLADSQMIDTNLLNEEKIKLSAFDKELILKIYNKNLQRLSGNMLKGELSADYVRGAKFALKSFKDVFKDYVVK